MRSDLYFEIVMHKLNHEKSVKTSIHFHGECSKDVLFFGEKKV